MNHTHVEILDELIIAKEEILTRLSEVKMNIYPSSFGMYPRIQI